MLSKLVICVLRRFSDWISAGSRMPSRLVICVLLSFSDWSFAGK